MTTITALVPMRHNSQRVPGKNFRELNGKPLFHYILETLSSIPEITQILVDTDSEPVLDGIAKFFPSVKTIRRPEHLRAPEIPMNEILAYDCAQIESDFYLQTHSTNPLLGADTLRQGVQRFLRLYPEYDSAFGVTRLQTRLWDELARPINHNPAILLQTQDLPPVFEENSCFYLFTKSRLLQRRNRIGERPLMIQVPRLEAVDIDEEADFQIAEILMGKRNK